MPKLPGTDILWRPCPKCSKRTYTSKRNATRAAELLHPVETLEAYSCGAARGWHFGHPKRATS